MEEKREGREGRSQSEQTSRGGGTCGGAPRARRGDPTGTAGAAGPERPYLGRGRLCSRCAAPAPGARPPWSLPAGARTARRSAARGPRQSLKLTRKSAVTHPPTPQLPEPPLSAAVRTCGCPAARASPPPSCAGPAPGTLPAGPSAYLAPGRGEGRACSSGCPTPWYSNALSP